MERGKGERRNEMKGKERGKMERRKERKGKEIKES